MVFKEVIQYFQQLRLLEVEEVLVVEVLQQIRPQVVLVVEQIIIIVFQVRLQIHLVLVPQTKVTTEVKVLADPLVVAVAVVVEQLVVAVLRQDHILLVELVELVYRLQ